MLLVAYENFTCHIFDLETGFFQYQFEFNHKLENKKLDDDEKDKPTKSIEVIEKIYNFLLWKQSKDEKSEGQTLEFVKELRNEVESYKRSGQLLAEDSIHSTK